MSKQIFTGLDLRGKNTISGLSTPSVDGDAIRLVDLNTAKTALDQAIALGDTQESQIRAAAVTQLTTTTDAQIQTLEAAYQTADTNLLNQLNQEIQAVISGFTAKDPVYAIVNATIALTGLAIDSPSFTGTVPANSRILTIAQGGDNIAHPDNRIWVAQAGAWVAASDFDDSAEIVHAVLIPVENGADNFVDTIYFLVEPTIFTGTVVGTTPLRWARWQGNDRVIADGTTLQRDGITFKTRLDPDQLITNSNGITLKPTFIALLQDLTNATGLLPVAQVAGLLAFVLANTLDTFAAPIAPVNLNSQKLTNLADPTLGTDAVNLQTYQAGIDALHAQTDGRNFYVDLNNGAVVNGDTVFTVTHNFNSFKLIEKIIDKNSGETVGTEFASVISNLNNSTVTFRNEASVSPTQYGLILYKVG